MEIPVEMPCQTRIVKPARLRFYGKFLSVRNTIICFLFPTMITLFREQTSVMDSSACVHTVDGATAALSASDCQ